MQIYRQINVTKMLINTTKNGKKMIIIKDLIHRTKISKIITK